MSDDGERVEAQRLHDRGLIPGHRPLGIRRVILISEWFGAVTVSSQIGGNDRELFGQPRRHLVPHRVGLRIAVQQQDGRTFAPADEVYLRSAGRYPFPLESLEQVLPLR